MFSSGTAKGSSEKPHTGSGAWQRRPKPWLPSPTTFSAFHVHHSEYELSTRPHRVKWRWHLRVSALDFPAVPGTVLVSHQEGFRRGHRRTFTVSGVLLQHARTWYPKCSRPDDSSQTFLEAVLSSPRSRTHHLSCNGRVSSNWLWSFLPLNHPPRHGQRSLQKQV